MNFNPEQDIKINKVYKKIGKKNNKIKVLLIFLILAIIGGIIGYSYYISGSGEDEIKKEFFQKLKNNDLAFFADNELYNGIIEKIEDGEYESFSNVNVSTNMKNNMFSDLELSKFQFEYDYKKSENEDKAYIRLLTKYAGNDVITMEGIKDGEKYAVKSDEIVNKYVGAKSENLENTVERTLGKEVDFTNGKILKNFLLDRQWINTSEIANYSGLKKYVQIFEQNTKFDNFYKKENVIVTLNDTQYTTTEYTVNLDENQTEKVFLQIAEQIAKDEKLMTNFVVSDINELDNEDSGIVDYTDNENMVEVPGEANNFNATINFVWDSSEEQNVETIDVESENNVVTNSTEHNNTIANNVIDNTVMSNNVVANNTVANNAVANNTVTNNIVSNNISTNNTINENFVGNTVENQTTEVQGNYVHIESIPQESVEEVPEVQQEPENIPEENPSEDVQDDIVEQEENLRTQGFIEVNDQIQIDDENTFVIGENYKDTIENISKISENIDWTSYLLTGGKANCTSEQLGAFLQEYILGLSKEKSTLSVKIYVAGDKTVKLVIELPKEEKSLDIEVVSISGKEKYLNIKSLVGKEEAEGYTIGLYKKQTDAGVKSKINVNKIYKSKISQKLNISLDTKGTARTPKCTNVVEMLFSNSDGEIELKIKNELNFDGKVRVEELNSENCLFIDEISEEEFEITKDAIIQKLKSVLNQKNRDLNIVSGDNFVIEQIVPSQVTEENSQKEVVKKVLIDVLSNKMGEYQNSGVQLKLEDLQNLQIPGYEVQISISSNLAIINVNGFSFKLDSDFNLSDS